MNLGRLKVLTLVAAILTFVLGVALIIIGETLGSKEAAKSTTMPLSAANNRVKALVSYTLPTGWQETTCSALVNIVYITPAGLNPPGCGAGASSPITIAIDPAIATDAQNSTICLQLLNNGAGIVTQSCSPFRIDGHQAFIDRTEYSRTSSYRRDTTVYDYYVDTSEAWIKVEYIYTTTNPYQTGFDMLATSVATGVK